jgi:hypothetical protein
MQYDDRKSRTLRWIRRKETSGRCTPGRCVPPKFEEDLIERVLLNVEC